MRVSGAGLNLFGWKREGMLAVPLRYTINRALKLVVTTGSGVVTFSECQAHQDRFSADPDFDPAFNQLLDMTAVTQLKLTANQTSTLARRKLFTSGSRRAFLVSSDASYGIARMAQAHNELSSNPSEVAVFRDRSAALKWLGLEEQP